MGFQDPDDANTSVIALRAQFDADAVWPCVSGAVKDVAPMAFPHAYLSLGSDAVASLRGGG